MSIMKEKRLKGKFAHLKMRSLSGRTHARKSRNLVKKRDYDTR